MVESEPEVEKVLREIRERVRSENKALIFQSRSFEALREANNALLRIKMNLATTERAWSSLPPVSSNRSGLISRVELWIKSRIKRITNWFTYEQVNFNSAVHQSLSDLHTALAAQEQTLEMLRQMLAANAKYLLEETGEFAPSDTSFASYEQSQIFQNQPYAQVEDLQNESRDRIQSILDEQRVCYKQLALQISESAIITDNARQDFEQRLTKLENSFKMQIPDK